MTHTDEIDLLDYWRILKKRKRLIAGIVAACFIISVVVSLVLPKKYTATTSILPPTDDNSMGTSLLANLTGGSNGIASGLFGGGTTSDLWVGILNSDNVKGALIGRFKLAEVYGTDTFERTRKTLDEALSIKSSKENIITVSVDDADPKRAADMAAAFVEELDRVNRELVMSGGKRSRVFLEKRLDETRAKLAESENAIRAFQEKNGAVKLDDQSKAIIDAIAEVKSRYMAKEVELQTLLSYATQANPRVQLLKSEVAELKNKLRELESGGHGAGRLFIPTERIPALSVEYGRLLRDAKVLQALFELVVQQYEVAKLQEAKDSPTIQVLDQARVPERPSKPKRVFIVLITTTISFFFAVFLALFLELYGNLRAAARG